MILENTLLGPVLQLQIRFFTFHMNRYGKYSLPSRTGLGSIPTGGPYIVDEFFSTVPGKNFDLCIISTRTKTH